MPGKTGLIRRHVSFEGATFSSATVIFNDAKGAAPNDFWRLSALLLPNQSAFRLIG
jgi:hypothetical protein